MLTVHRRVLWKKYPREIFQSLLKIAQGLAGHCFAGGELMFVHRLLYFLCHL